MRLGRCVLACAVFALTTTTGLVRAGSDAAILERVAEVHRLGLRTGDTAPTAPMDSWKSAASGTIVTGVHRVSGHRASMGWGIAVVDVPMDRMWAALNEELHH